MEIDEFEDEINVPDDEPLWSIEDDTLFQPSGLISHSSFSNNKTKSVFVTWNEYYLINYRFKKSTKSNRMDMTKVRIPLPNNTQLRSIHMLEYNTLLLMSDGRVHCFGSIKSLHSISWLKGVRAFSRAQDGFTVILHNAETRQLLLQTYLDLPSLSKGESTMQYSFDITYDEQNIFQSDWQNDPYTLLTIYVDQQQETFLQCLFGAEIVALKEFHIFSIAGHVFCLIPQDDTEQKYHIELLCVYATSVSFIRLLPAQNLCLVFLKCGSVDIWYVSQLSGIKQRQMHYTGAEWLDYDASSENGDFYYTDGEQLVCLRFQYNAQFDDCLVQCSVKTIPGMQACTWVQHIEQLVCLSDNNIFYRIAFGRRPDEVAGKTEIASELSDLTPMAIERLRCNAQVIKHYEQQPVILLAAIKRELHKQQLVAVARNDVWTRNIVEARLEFRRHLPEYGPNVLTLHTVRRVDLCSSGIYALLQLKFPKEHDLMHCNFWQLVVYFGQEVHMYRVPTNLLLSRNCMLIVPVKKLPDQCLPKFTLKFVAFIELQSQHSAVFLPVTVQEDGQTYRALFSGQLHSLNLYHKSQPADILRGTSARKTRIATTQKITMPSSLDLEQISVLCNATGMIKENHLELFFLDSELRVECNTEDNQTVLMLQSEDISLIYYLKKHIFLNQHLQSEESAPDNARKLSILVSNYFCHYIVKLILFMLYIVNCVVSRNFNMKLNVFTGPNRMRKRKRMQKFNWNLF